MTELTCKDLAATLRKDFGDLSYALYMANIPEKDERSRVASTMHRVHVAITDAARELESL